MSNEDEVVVSTPRRRRTEMGQSIDEYAFVLLASVFLGRHVV
jgi:hypothetical protein